MKINVIGLTDKRPVIYSLIKVLQYYGDVLFITENRRYRRLLEDQILLGNFGNCLVSITDASPDEVWEEIGYNESDFDFIIYDTGNRVPIEDVIHILVEGDSLTEEEQSILDCLEEEELIKIKLGCGVMTTEVMNVTELIESKQTCLPYNDRQINKAMSEALSKIVKGKPKELLKLLKRRR